MNNFSQFDYDANLSHTQGLTDEPLIVCETNPGSCIAFSTLRVFAAWALTGKLNNNARNTITLPRDVALNEAPTGYQLETHAHACLHYSNSHLTVFQDLSCLIAELKTCN